MYFQIQLKYLKIISTLTLQKATLIFINYEQKNHYLDFTFQLKC